MADEIIEASETTETMTQIGDKLSVEFSSDTPIETEADLFAKTKLDQSKWRVLKLRLSGSQVSMKMRRQVGMAKGKPIYETYPLKKQNFAISATLERIPPDPLREAGKILFDRMAEIAPKFRYKPVVAKQSRSKGRHLCELGLYDIHFGKLCWAEETGEDYDLRIAETIYANAVADLMDKVSGYNVDRWLLTIGNDLFHFDNYLNQTTGGTPQDCDGRYPKVIAAGEMAVVNAVNQMLLTAPVDILLVPGNHDRQSSLHAARFAWAFFHNHPHVRVDFSANPRKYYEYGQTLLGFTHSNEEKPADLPLLMATEVPAKWAATSCHEFHVGHFHKTKNVQTVTVDTHTGTLVRTLPSLCSTDAWHHRRGYVGGRHSADGLLYEYDEGFAGLFPTLARTA